MDRIQELPDCFQIRTANSTEAQAVIDFFNCINRKNSGYYPEKAEGGLSFYCIRGYHNGYGRTVCDMARGKSKHDYLSFVTRTLDYPEFEKIVHLRDIPKAESKSNTMKTAQEWIDSVIENPHYHCIEDFKRIVTSPKSFQTIANRKFESFRDLCEEFGLTGTLELHHKGKIKFKPENTQPSSFKEEVKENTPEYWFNLIADKELREKCLRNYKDKPYRTILIGNCNLGESLSVGFVWDHTPEGHKYWNEIIKQARNNEIPLLTNKTKTHEKTSTDRKPILSTVTTDIRRGQKITGHPVHGRTQRVGIKIGHLSNQACSIG